MNIDRNKIRNYVTLVSVLIVVFTFSWMLYDNLVFKFKSTTPDSLNIATSSTYVDFNFSQPIKSASMVYLSGATDSTQQEFTIENKHIRVKTGVLKEGNNYVIKITNIKSEWFNNKIDDVTFSFTPRYIDFNQLSTEQQKAAINQSNSGQVDDPFLNNSFPVIEDKFMLEVENVGDGKSIKVTVTILSEIPDYDNGGRVTQVSDNDAEKIYEDVVKLVKKKGGSLDKYFVLYSNDHLSEKYGFNASHDH